MRDRGILIQGGWLNPLRLHILPIESNVLGVGHSEAEWIDRPAPVQGGVVEAERSAALDEPHIRRAQRRFLGNLLPGLLHRRLARIDAATDGGPASLVGGHAVAAPHNQDTAARLQEARHYRTLVHKQ